MGLCSYCESPTQETCQLCGRAMCADHKLEDSLVCVGCARGQQWDDR